MMTKTEAKRTVAEMRREAAKITDILTPTPQWILDQTGGTNPGPDEIAAVTARALGNIAVLSERLRKGLVVGS